MAAVSTGETTRQGSPASYGIAIGRAYVVDRRRFKVPKRHIAPEEIPVEEARFRRAIRESFDQLERIKDKLVATEGKEHFHILEAHQLIMQDEHMADASIKRIHQELVNAEWALTLTVTDIKRIFDAIEDDYFRDRRSDIDFVSERILRNLLGFDDRPVTPPPDAVVVAHDLAPADTAHLQAAAVAALVTDAGSRTSHTAILARAHGIPSVVGLENITQLVGSGDLLIVDGTRGVVVLNPTPETVSLYRARARHEAAVDASLLSDRANPATTKDGQRIRMYCNVEEEEELPAALAYGAEGIGLFRTEFLYLARPDPPSEEDHYRQAVSVLKRMDGRMSTFRTFDLGGDKGGPFHTLLDAEVNPALGLRSIRLCLTDSGLPLFMTQLRALLRAAAHGPLRIMFPMISGLEELRRAKDILEECKLQLTERGIPFRADVPVGVMVEMPSAALTADLLAREAAFFSIGTNDLIQYLLAIDRVNEHVSYLYRPTHPALLRLVRDICQAAKRAGIPVSMCGEVAGEPLMSLVLIGLGLEELSMDASTIPLVKNVVRSSTLHEAKELAAQALELDTPDAVEHLLRKYMSDRFSDDILRVGT